MGLVDGAGDVFMSPGTRGKALLKRVLKTGVRWSGQRDAAQTRILTYHSVGRRKHPMNVTPEAFAEQMAWLAEHAAVIPLAAATAGEPGVAITFDDGYRDNLKEAAPILAQWKFPATLFAVTGRMGGHLDHDEPCADARLLDWDELREIESTGVTIGAHTLRHCRLSSLSEAEQRSEIIDCKAQLEAALGHGVQCFAYPFGSALDYDETSVALVREAGFDWAFSNRYGVVQPVDRPFVLRRIWVDDTDSQATFQAKVDGRLDRLTLLDSSWGIRGRRLFNRLLSR
jgi:peptidoglycan/xylan/chitin deacetylase (PgdA/CDA1 family)